MKVTYGWLKEFVDIKLSPEKLADKLTFSGLSVALFEPVGDDWVYDIEITSNRPDWLSVAGISREVAAITGAKLKIKAKKIIKAASGNISQLSIHIEDKKDCQLYCGNLIKGVKVAESPAWLKTRLEALGMRTVNNIVDITNYCMIETGQPMHAFDYDKLSKATIVVRRAKKDEKLVLIDGSEKKLDEDILVIADSLKPIAVAGIMGGQFSEVSQTTKNIMLESACFSPIVVRRGSRALGVASDSSYRFERGVEPQVVKNGLDLATEMILKLCGGELIVSKQSGGVKEAIPRKISVSLREVSDILSISFTLSQVKRMLEPLGFAVKKQTNDVFSVVIPYYRRDVSIPQDITEEIIRVYGYENIPLTFPVIKPFVFQVPKMQVIETRLKKLLSSLGLKEIITYSLTAQEDYVKSSISLNDNTFELASPLSEDFKILRPTLIPSMLNCVALNVNRSQKNLEFFEVSRIFKGEVEEMFLGVVLCGARRESWQKESKPYSFYDLKGIAEVILKTFEADIARIERIQDLNFSDEAAQIIIENKRIAVLFKVSEKVKRNFGIKAKEDIFMLELSVEALSKIWEPKKKIKPISLIPSIARDISLVAGPQASFERVKEVIKSNTKDYLQGIFLSDCYKGKEIPADSLGLTISVEYGARDKTLTDAEIGPIHQAVLEKLVKELGVTLR